MRDGRSGFRRRERTKRGVDDIVHVEGKIDPVSDAQTVETELMLADLESLEKRVVPVEKKSKTGEKESKEQYTLMMKALLAGR